MHTLLCKKNLPRKKKTKKFYLSVDVIRLLCGHCCCCYLFVMSAGTAQVKEQSQAWRFHNGMDPAHLKQMYSLLHNLPAAAAAAPAESASVEQMVSELNAFCSETLPEAVRKLIAVDQVNKMHIAVPQPPNTSSVELCPASPDALATAYPQVPRKRSRTTAAGASAGGGAKRLKKNDGSALKVGGGAKKEKMEVDAYLDDILEEDDDEALQDPDAMILNAEEDEGDDDEAADEQTSRVSPSSVVKTSAPVPPVPGDERFQMRLENLAKQLRLHQSKMIQRIEYAGTKPKDVKKKIIGEMRKEYVEHFEQFADECFEECFGSQKGMIDAFKRGRVSLVEDHPFTQQQVQALCTFLIRQINVPCEADAAFLTPYKIKKIRLAVIFLRTKYINHLDMCQLGYEASKNICEKRISAAKFKKCVTKRLNTTMSEYMKAASGAKGKSRSSV